MTALAPDFPAVTSWVWVVIAMIASAASFAAGAAVLLGVSPVRIPVVVAFGGQVAAAATKLVTPASLGLVGLNARLVQTHGAPLPTALAAVGASQVAQLVLTLAALAVALPVTDVALDVPVPSSTALWGSVIGLAVAALAAVLMGRSRVARLRRRALEATRPLLSVARTPYRTMLVAVGCLTLTAALTFSLWASLEALGGGVSVATVAVVLLLGSAVGSALPTPGGVGGVEGAMVGAFAATGVAVEVALPAVLLFRVVTFWLPVPLGAAALVWLRRTGRV